MSRAVMLKKLRASPGPPLHSSPRVYSFVSPLEVLKPPVEISLSLVCIIEIWEES